MFSRNSLSIMAPVGSTVSGEIAGQPFRIEVPPEAASNPDGTVHVLAPSPDMLALQARCDRLELRILALERRRWWRWW